MNNLQTLFPLRHRPSDRPLLNVSFKNSAVGIRGSGGMVLDGGGGGGDAPLRCHSDRTWWRGGGCRRRRRFGQGRRSSVCKKMLSYLTVYLKQWS